MWRVLLISFLVVVVGQHLITFLYIMGYHKYVYKHRPGNCRKLAGIDNGMQDIEVFLDGFALVASGYSRTNRRTGSIRAYNFTTGNLTKVAVSGRPQGEFHPIGLSKYRNRATD
ncbi:uncharacterized protein [Diadema antillarum]|uniref:uncharacterized protein n=1 Tax=Diadema antillarum TaxID=105358 RepID=UPI003A85AA1C